MWMGSSKFVTKDLRILIGGTLTIGRLATNTGLAYRQAITLINEAFLL